MLQLHGQCLKPERRQRRLTEPHLFYRIDEQSKQTPSIVKSGRRRKSDRTNGIGANVSGKKYFFTTRLLSRYPDSLLSHKHKRKYFYDCIRDEYFFDRNRTAFESIFTFYESRGTLALPHESFPEQILTDEFYFFGLYEYLSDFDRTNKVVIPSALKKKQVVPKRKCQKEIWKICEIPDSSALARLINLFSLLVIISSAIILFVDTLPGFRRSETLILTSHLESPPMPAKNSSDENISLKSSPEGLKITSAIEAFCISWFTFELLTRFVVSPEKKKFFLRALNIIDLISIIPFYISLIVSSRKFGTPLYIMRVLRLSRVFRVIKLSRYITTMKVLGKTVKASIKDLWTMCFLILIGTVLFGSLAYYCEQWNERTVFNSIPISCWWALVTITTLGYGDMAPITLGKQLLSMKPLVPHKLRAGLLMHYIRSPLILFIILDPRAYAVLTTWLPSVGHAQEKGPVRAHYNLVPGARDRFGRTYD